MVGFSKAEWFSVAMLSERGTYHLHTTVLETAKQQQKQLQQTGAWL